MTGVQTCALPISHYLSAARALRLIRPVPQVTPTEYQLAYLGEEYVAASEAQRPAVIVRGVLIAPHVVYVAECLGIDTPLAAPTPRELHDVTLVEGELADLAPPSDGTPRRRARTLMSWLKTVDRLARQLR